ncbi:uncharacterized protein LOC114725873 [Neltuma alba]|uniref:uncharacterized protein LOC114725873 n=1 Tax=Neltuma alba TaxID=207710 RepID=UPI0010A35618|nr:uncharacterized protein LOC114725873 [Prosopis alba]
MASLPVFRFLLFLHSVLVLFAGYGNGKHREKCSPSFQCGDLGILRFPFTKDELPHCGFFAIHGCDDHDPSSDKTIQLQKNGKPLLLKEVVPRQQHHNIKVTVQDQPERFKSRTCEVFDHDDADLIPLNSPMPSSQIKSNFTCNLEHHMMRPHACPGYHDYCDQLRGAPPPPNLARSSLPAWSTLRLPCKDVSYTKDLWFSCGEIVIEVELPVDDDCDKCNQIGGQCLVDDNYYCDTAEKDHGLLKLGFGLGLGGNVIIYTIKAF